jgi:transcription-repair coupling factor (superfamily II helicase)
LIPDGYVEDLGVRLGLYRRLADLTTEQEREAFAAELIDRFGPLPNETKQLLDVTAVKVTCKSLGISKLDAGPKGVVVTFRDDTRVDPAQLMMLVRSRPGKMKLRPDSKLVVMGVPADAAPRMHAVKGLLKELAATAPD